MRQLILAIVFAACTADDDATPLPTCEEIGAPDSLFCNAGGLCEWSGQQCCVEPRAGTLIDPLCEHHD